IANISPSLSSSEHTLNTLRYTSRVKELPISGDALNTVQKGSDKIIEESITEPETKEGKFTTGSDDTPPEIQNKIESIESLQSSDIGSYFDRYKSSSSDYIEAITKSLSAFKAKLSTYPCSDAKKCTEKTLELCHYLEKSIVDLKDNTQSMMKYFN
ncbi:MAG: Kinesin-like protein kif2b, partial [Paramarteilia canceri]